MFWDPFRPFGGHFSAFPAETENRKNFKILTILGHFGPFLAHFEPILGPQMASGAPKCRGGTGQNGPTGVQQAIKMCFGTILDHLEPLDPIEGEKKIEKKITFDIFLTFFDMSEIC